MSMRLLQIKAKNPSAPTPSFIPAQSRKLQRKSLLGGASGLTCEFADSHRKPLVSQPPLIQAKLAINQPNDQYEQEADLVADAVMRMPEPRVQRQVEPEEDEEAIVQPKPAVDAEYSIQRQEALERTEDGKELLRTEGQSIRIAEMNPDIESRIQAQAIGGGGQPLPGSVRTYFEPRFGYDFNQVRTHTDAQAAESAQALNAKAFTVGQNVVFGAGQYVPNTYTGKRLLAHELAHVVQQKHNSPISGKLVQRAITVQNPAAQTPNVPVPFLNMTNAEIVERWINELCPSGNWVVNGSTGVVSSPNRATFCSARPTRGSAHFSTSGTPTSCGCICDLTAAGSRDIRVHPANTFNVAVGGGHTAAVSVTASGEGVAVYPDTGAGRPGYDVGVSGREFVGIEGAGDTSPHSGTGQNQVLRDPPWIIFGHEVCGHASLQTEPTRLEHSHTPPGDLSAVDIENRIRREHSTLTDNYGLRKGTFSDATGANHEGSVYKVSADETLSGIARRVGIPIASMLNHIWREDGTAITAATQDTVAVNERLLIEGVFWHEVIQDETMSSIATMWDIPLNSLIRANPQISNPNLILVGQRLLVPAS